MSHRTPGPPANARDPNSVGALISGILAIVLSLFCGILAIPTGILAIVLGVMGRRRSVEQGRGTGLATTGIALGVLAMAIFAVWAVVSANTAS